MSHMPLRKNPACLNCGTFVNERFCTRCGQENTEPKETVWHFVTHFVNDILHFDGKFFNTLKYLMFRPGYLSKQYIEGKRAGYLDPVRMYLFTSFIFFIVFFSIMRIDQGQIKGSISFSDDPKIDASVKDELKSQNVNIDTAQLRTRSYTRQEYDSLISKGIINPSWVEKRIYYQQIKLKEKYGEDQGGFMANFVNSFNHNFPKMLFVSLPFAALILQLLYIRRKNFFYVGHGIFIIHYYIFIFIMMLLAIGLTKFFTLTNLNRINYSGLIAFILILAYLYKAMRRYYGQKRGKTFLKWVLFNSAFFILLIILTGGLVMLSFFEMI